MLMLSWHAHHTDDLEFNPHQPLSSANPEIIKLMQYHNMEMTPGSVPVSGSQ